jgi:hypothetical protein
MEYTYSNGVITFPGKELTLLDKLVLEFTTRLNVKYVIVSGYVAILFGRSRNTEDVDIFIEKLDERAFEEFYNGVIKDGKFYCLNAESPEDAYVLLTKDGSSIRFAEEGTFDPNFEIKFPANRLNRHSLENALIVKLGGNRNIRIGPLELQLAYKLKLGSEKDYEDAAHTYIAFKKDLNLSVLRGFLDELGIKRSLAERILDKDVYEKR